MLRCLILLLFCLSACDEGGEGYPPYDPVTPTGIVGHWKARCEGMGTGRSRKREIEMRSNSYSFWENFFTDDQCQSIKYRVNRFGSLQIAGPQPGTPALRIIMSPFIMFWDVFPGEKPLETSTKDFCGGIQNNPAMDADVLDALCGADSFPATDLYDIFVVEANRLRFGDLKNASEASWPTTLQSPIFTRQE